MNPAVKKPQGFFFFGSVSGVQILCQTSQIVVLFRKQRSFFRGCLLLVLSPICAGAHVVFPQKSPDKSMGVGKTVFQCDRFDRVPASNQLGVSMG